jgi:tetratricopeptide (TPR) repeat protein
MNVADPESRLTLRPGTDLNLQEAFAVIEEIASADPSNVEARRDLALAQRIVAGSIAAQGDPVRALAIARTSFDILETLLRDDADNSDTVFTAILSCHQIASFERTLEHWKEALDAYETALRIGKERQTQNGRDIPASRLNAIALYGIGEVSEAMTNWRAAADAFRRSLAFWQEVPDTMLPAMDRAAKAELPGRVRRCEESAGSGS